MDNIEDRFFESLSESEPETLATPAPSRLKAKIYSALLRRQAESGPLATLSSSQDSGRSLCNFEQLVQISPLPDRVQSFNYCQVCHARLLAEYFENAPIYWNGCSYVRFQNR